MLFQKQIAQVITNIREARFPGGSITTQPQPQTPEEATKLAEDLLGPEDAGDHESATPAAQDGEVEQLRVSNQQLNRELTFERVYRVIYGTQLWLLQMLEAQRKKNPMRPLLYEVDLKGFFRDHENQAGQGRSFEDWKRFLLQLGLMGQLGGGYTITELGREFLLYLERLMLPPKLY